MALKVDVALLLFVVFPTVRYCSSKRRCCSICFQVSDAFGCVIMT